jgi:hypothetical protein
MDNFLPEALPPVSYFLQSFNNNTTLWVIRIVVGIVALLSITAYFCFRKKIPAEDENPMKKKKK